jgi:hypothetical protein
VIFVKGYSGGGLPGAARIAIFAFFAAAAACTSRAADWCNLTEDRHLGGRKASSGYLAGKVVLVCRWEASSPECRRMLGRLEQVWQGFKTKPFVVVGSHVSDDGEAAKSALAGAGASFPVYRDARLAAGEPFSENLPFIYVVDISGKIVYRGRNDRIATQACVTAIADGESPRNLGQWRRYLDYELENLPGRAYLRVLDFRKAFPGEAREYDEKARVLAGIPEVKRIAELVKASRELKDCSFRTENDRRRHAEKIDAVLRRYSRLAAHSDYRVAQEAKNAIADLKWTKASL